MMWILLVGCWEPRVTTNTGMVGVIEDHSGQRLAGLSVSSVEARAVTDDQGHFGVSYKPPSTYVDFKVGSTLYQRVMLDEDKETSVTVVLPETRTATLVCGVDQPCNALLSWSFSDGLIGRVLAKCKPGARAEMTGVPVGEPAVSCQVDATAPTEAIAFADIDDVLYLGNPPSPVEIGVKAEDKVPDGCLVYVDGKPALRSGHGDWRAYIHGPTDVWAVCDGRPTHPTLLTRETASVELEWSSTGPSLDTTPPGVWGGPLWLVYEVNGKEAGRIGLEAPTDSYALPPLVPGVYWFLPQDVAPPRSTSAAIAGTMRLNQRPDGTVVGRLTVDKDIPAGRIPVESDGGSR
jgi:hypothetical protein